MRTSQNKSRSTSEASSIDASRRSCDIVIDDDILIPGWVNDFDSFRRWSTSDAFPEQGKFAWLSGDIWVELCAPALKDYPHEKMQSHTLVESKGQTTRNGHSDWDCHNGTIIIDEAIFIPPSVRDFESFRRWTLSDDFPQFGRISFLDGQIWVDLGMETNFRNRIKSIIMIVLGSIILRERLGNPYIDGMRLIHPITGASNEPDGMFVSTTSMNKARVTLSNGDQSLEVNGAPDMVLEVVSKTSVKKDTQTLVIEYATAGIKEYWLVDSRNEKPHLQLFRLRGGKYVRVRNVDGWVKSSVFGRSFRLTCQKNAKGWSDVNLETR